MKAAIDMVPRKLPGGDFSHTGAWAYLRANQLKHVGVDAQVLSEKGRGINTDWSEFDVVYLYHTLDFEPDHPYTINVFDGPAEHTAKHFERIIWPVNNKVKYVSLDYPMPNYGYRCKRKRDRADENSKMSDYWKAVDWDAVQEKCDNITDWLLDPGVKFTKPFAGRTKDLWANQVVGIEHIHRKLTMGDSHTSSVYVPKSLVLRKDGRTMSGIIKKGIQKEVTDYGFDWNQIDDLTCYYGNIDIRHHIMRTPDPKAYTVELIKNYAEMLKASGKNIEVVCPLPIEDESRKLPSTGNFQGTPFYGSRAERQEIVRIFSEELQSHAAKNNWKIFQWPEAWYKMDGIEFMETIMERPRSVHLARRYYRWDLEADCLNQRHFEDLKPSSGLLEF